jgi:hypothetical protein
MLDWLRDIDLRRRTQAGLNKGEARNALARALFFNQLGELRDRRFENQTYRASGLNLLVAAIILWNTRYLEQAIAGMAVPPELPATSHRSGGSISRSPATTAGTPTTALRSASSGRYAHPHRCSLHDAASCSPIVHATPGAPYAMPRGEAPGWP